MPKALERKLWRTVQRKHPRWSKRRKSAYVYGTLRKTGWVPRTHRVGGVSNKVFNARFKRCVVIGMGVSYITTPKMARAAFNRITKKCRRMVTADRHP